MKYYVAIVSQMYNQYHIFYLQVKNKDEYIKKMPPCLGEILAYKRKGRENKAIPIINLHITQWNGLKEESIHDESGNITIHIHKSLNELCQKCGVYHYRAHLWNGEKIRSAMNFENNKATTAMNKKHNRAEIATIIQKYFTLL